LAVKILCLDVKKYQYKHAGHVFLVKLAPTSYVLGNIRAAECPRVENGPLRAHLLRCIFLIFFV